MLGVVFCWGGGALCFHFKSPSTSVVKESTARLFCCEVPEIDWVNLSFK